MRLDLYKLKLKHKKDITQFGVSTWSNFSTFKTYNQEHSKITS